MGSLRGDKRYASTRAVPAAGTRWTAALKRWQGRRRQWREGAWGDLMRAPSGCLMAMVILLAIVISMLYGAGPYLFH
jgi:hypothetical protein